MNAHDRAWMAPHVGRWWVAAIVTVSLTGVLSACASSSSPNAGPPATPAGSQVVSSPSASKTHVGSIQLPPAAGQFSYQIGGAYPPPSGTTIVDRDRSDPSVAGIYSICYINAFQAQTADVAWWKEHHDQLLLHAPDGHLIIDQDWNEPLFDISTAAKREALLQIEGGWLDGCAHAGYQGVEPDNLDSYTRSEGRLTAADALAFAALLARRAHADGLAIAQKNAADLSVAGHKAGLDFAVAEECQVYTECNSYTQVYGRHVIEIEYTDNPRSAFTTACAQRGGQISIVLRDRDVTPRGQAGYVETWCPRTS